MRTKRFAREFEQWTPLGVNVRFYGGAANRDPNRPYEKMKKRKRKTLMHVEIPYCISKMFEGSLLD